MTQLPLRTWFVERIVGSDSRGDLCYTTETTIGRHEIIHTQTVHAGWTKILVATTRLPDGSMITREIEDHGAAVCVLPYNRCCGS